MMARRLRRVVTLRMWRGFGTISLPRQRDRVAFGDLDNWTSPSRAPLGVFETSKGTDGRNLFTCLHLPQDLTQGSRDDDSKAMLESLSQHGAFYLKLPNNTMDGLKQLWNCFNTYNSLDLEERVKIALTKEMCETLKIDIPTAGYTAFKAENTALALKGDTNSTGDCCEKFTYHQNIPVDNFPGKALGKALTEAYYSELIDISETLFKHIGPELLGFNDTQMAMFPKSLNAGSLLRYLSYPDFSAESNNKDRIRMGAHSDLTFFTLLFQTPSDSGFVSLEAKIDGKWTPIPAVEGTIVVQIGEFLRYASEGRISSTEHRVVLPETNAEAKGSARESLALFMSPDMDTKFKTLPGGTFHQVHEELNKDGCKEISFGEILEAVISRGFVRG
ncbi:hypothetical protein AAMO2058_000176100 [Amorphochlora amoebiformis]